MQKTLENWLANHNFSQMQASLLVHMGLILFVIILAFIAYAITRRVLLTILAKVVKRTKAKWDDILLEQRFFRIVSHFAPAIVLHHFAPFALYGFPEIVERVNLLLIVYMLLVGILALNALLNAALAVYNSYEVSKRIPLKGFIQVAKIILASLGVILTLSLLMGESPLVLLSGLGALTAVLLLIFKDPILGFVAGIQLSANDMVAVGDWIEMPKYGADGDVIDVALTTVKVRNWDKTITTIPTYSLISDSFKNWRGMKESGGRRIARAVHLDMTSVRFCTEEMIERFSRIQFLEDYIARKKEELKEYNEKQGIDDSVLVNGRRMTNLGTFRAYVINYLRNHPMIHQEMTFLVRHLEPSEKGLPIQIYVFSKDQIWANYESIQADILDHILAVIPFFDLRVFQAPSGHDVREAGRMIQAAFPGATGASAS